MGSPAEDAEQSLAVGKYEHDERELPCDAEPKRNDALGKRWKSGRERRQQGWWKRWQRGWQGWWGQKWQSSSESTGTLQPMRRYAHQKPVFCIPRAENLPELLHAGTPEEPLSKCTSGRVHCVPMLWRNGTYQERLLEEHRPMREVLQEGAHQEYVPASTGILSAAATGAAATGSTSTNSSCCETRCVRHAGQVPCEMDLPAVWRIHTRRCRRGVKAPRLQTTKRETGSCTRSKKGNGNHDADESHDARNYREMRTRKCETSQRDLAHFKRGTGSVEQDTKTPEGPYQFGTNGASGDEGYDPKRHSGNRQAEAEVTQNRSRIGGPSTSPRSNERCPGKRKP